MKKIISRIILGIVATGTVATAGVVTASKVIENKKEENIMTKEIQSTNIENQIENTAESENIAENVVDDTTDEVVHKVENTINAINNQNVQSNQQANSSALNANSKENNIDVVTEKTVICTVRIPKRVTDLGWNGEPKNIKVQVGEEYVYNNIITDFTTDIKINLKSTGFKEVRLYIDGKRERATAVDFNTQTSIEI